MQSSCLGQIARHSLSLKIKIRNQSIQLISINDNSQKNFFINYYWLAKIYKNWIVIVIDFKKINNNHLDFSKMALTLHKIIPRTIQDVQCWVVQQTTRLCFPFPYSKIHSNIYFLMQIIEITRTLTLLFLLFHPNADATTRLEGFALLPWAELLPLL